MGKKNCIIFLFFNTPKIWLVSYFTLYVYIIIEYDILHQQQKHISHPNTSGLFQISVASWVWMASISFISNLQSLN